MESYFISFLVEIYICVCDKTIVPILVAIFVSIFVKLIRVIYNF